MRDKANSASRGNKKITGDFSRSPFNLINSGVNVLKSCLTVVAIAQWTQAVGYCTLRQRQGVVTDAFIAPALSRQRVAVARIIGNPGGRCPADYFCRPVTWDPEWSEKLWMSTVEIKEGSTFGRFVMVRWMKNRYQTLWWNVSSDSAIMQVFMFIYCFNIITHCAKSRKRGRRGQDRQTAGCCSRAKTRNALTINQCNTTHRKMIWNQFGSKDKDNGLKI